MVFHHYPSVSHLLDIEWEGQLMAKSVTSINDLKPCPLSQLEKDWVDWKVVVGR